MSNLIVPKDVSENMQGLKSTTELRNEEGVLLGYFEPAMYDEDWVPDGLTKEEFQLRLAEEPTGRTWAEIRADLEKLAQ